MKVDPLSIKTDQRKRDTRRDAWDRDYMGAHYTIPAASTTQISAATPVLVFAFFFVCLLILLHAGD